MKTVWQHPARLIVLLLITGTVGLLVLMHVTSAPRSRCENGTSGAGIIKLI